MTALEKYNNAFVEVFAVESSLLNDNFSKDTVSAWDSVHQLNIIAILEEAFDIMLDPEDIMGFSSYKEGRDILRKYEVEF
jgi:acyl carrier protein